MLDSLADKGAISPFATVAFTAKQAKNKETDLSTRESINAIKRVSISAL